MKKIFKNKSGFTLVEMLIAAGMSGVIALVAYTALNDSKKVVNTSLVTNESTFLRNQIISNLGNPDICNLNFEGQLITRPNILSISRRQRVDGGAGVDTFNIIPFLEKNKSYGEVAVNTLTVTNISTAPTLLQVTPPVYSDTRMTLLVEYSIGVGLKRSSGKKTDSVAVEISIGRTTDGLRVKSCFADIAAMIRQAIQFSCEGNGATYDPAAGSHGTCTHNKLEVRNDVGTVVVPQICPAGQFLYSVTSASGTPPAQGVTTYRCKKFSTIAPSCAPQEFMKGVKSDGSPDCISLTTLLASIPNGFAIATIPGGYQGINMNCGTDQVLSKISSSGLPTCIPKVITGSCPLNTYVTGINPNGSPQCTAFPKNSATCPAGSFLQRINSDGSTPAGGCQPLTIPATCSGVHEVMTGITAAGTAICSNNL